jgi:erythromycin esterase
MLLKNMKEKFNTLKVIPEKSEHKKNFNKMDPANEKMKTKYHPLESSRDLDPLLNRIGDARLVLLGEASHGTHEFYTWRSAITRRLIEEKGFNFIAVEGDWPDCYRVNRYVKGYSDQDKTPEEILKAFNRWPTWMWANWEIVSLVTWMKDYNSKRSANKKAGFYGLDVYSLWESMEALIKYLRNTDPSTAVIAEKALDCFSGYGRNEQIYAINSLSASCKDEVIQLLKEVRLRSLSYDQDPEASLNTTQNAYVAVEAEKYYRNMVAFDDKTWNIRDKHMMDTLDRLLEFHGPNSKTIVWEHNTHIGDARYTNMRNVGMYNIGQLAREQYSENETVLVGFGSYKGTVIAGNKWGALMQEMEVPEAKAGSVEDFLHKNAGADCLVIFDRIHEDTLFNKAFPHRAIGVVYHPQNEEYNYVPSYLSRRYDAFMFFDQTIAVHPLYMHPDKKQVPETYPFEF